MKQKGFIVATGVTPCSKAGHQLRTRHGHCAMCDPTKIRYQQRYSEEAYVYIAATPSNQNLVKVGISTNLEARAQTLNTTGGYGGYSDWEFVFTTRVKNAGEIEHKLHDSLKDYSTTLNYDKNGKSQAAQELFEVSAKEAIKQIKKLFDN